MLIVGNVPGFIHRNVLIVGNVPGFIHRNMLIVGNVPGLIRRNSEFRSWISVIDQRRHCFLLTYQE